VSLLHASKRELAKVAMLLSNNSLELAVIHQVNARHGRGSIEVSSCALQVCRAAAQLGRYTFSGTRCLC
jgi:hypothetical protein